MAKKKGDPRFISPAKWHDIKQGFVVQCKSHTELAKEFGVSATSISIKSSEGKWVDERSQYWLDIERELSDLAKKETVETKKNILKTGIYFFGKGVQHLQKRLEEAEKNNKGLSNKEAWDYFNKGVEIVSMFMEKDKDRVPQIQSEESEAAKEIRRFFDKLHGVPTE